MIVERGLNQKIDYVLNKIKEYSTFSNAYQSISYEIKLIPLEYKNLTPQDECDILNLLNEYKIIKILSRQIDIALRIVIILKVIQPEFDTILQTINKVNNDLDLKDDNKLALKLHTRKKNKDLCFPKYYLIHEINNFKIILKYLLKSDLLKQKNYKYIITILNSLNTFIEDVLEIKYTDWLKDNFGINVDDEIGNQNISGIKPDNYYNQETLFRQTSLPISGEIKVTGLKEGLAALSTKGKVDLGPKFPFKIPAGTQWHNVIIKFLDDERIEIHVKRLKHTTNYKEMEMLGKGKIPTPNEQWNFLKVLAKCYGEISIRDPEAKDKYKKQKQELTETLRNYFSIDYDPFYPYQSSPEKAGNSYKIKIFLIPPPQKDNIIDSNKDNDPLGIQEYLQENSFR